MAVYKKEDQWVADFYIGGRKGRRVRKSAPTRKLAEALVRDWKAKEFRGDILQISEDRKRLSDLLEKYASLHHPGSAGSTCERDGYVFSRLTEHFGNPYIDRISRRELEAYKAWRRSTVKAVTVNLELRVISSLFGRAMEWGYLQKNPITAVKKYRLDEKEPRFLMPAEGRALMDAAEGQMRTFIVTALNTGLRKGELFALTWNDIDFEREELRVRRSKGKRFRVLPLNDLVLQALREHPRHITSSVLFHNPDGSGWKDIRGSFNATLTKAGLPRIRIHDLRHSFISNLVMAGEVLRTVQELAGHRSITTTMRYAHLSPGRLKDSVTRLKWSSGGGESPSIVLNKEDG